MMEGFSLECKLVGSSSWAFDPVSADVLLMPHARAKSIICEHEATSSLLFPSGPGGGGVQGDNGMKFDFPVTLTSLTPFALLSDEDLNNNSHTSHLSTEDIPLLTSASSFLSLDPLLDGGGHGHGQGTGEGICFTNNVAGQRGLNEVEGDENQNIENLRLPKFEELQLRKDSDDHPRNHMNPTGHFDFHSSEVSQQGQVECDAGGGSPCNSSSTSGGGGGGLYFNIQDLTSYSSSSAPRTSTSSFTEIPAEGEDDDSARCDAFLLDDLAEFDEGEGQRLLDEVDEVEEEEDDVFEDRVQCTKLEDEEDDEGGKAAELKCKFCGFVCCSKSSLGIHERRHTGERPYSCKHCGRLFNSAQCCKHHERLHTGDKPFECQYCGKKYAVSTRLKRHERVHTREEPYKCIEPGCGKTFRWFDAFRDHRNTHNGVALYLCSVCGKSFTSYLKFYYHERGHFLKRERERDKKSKLGGQGAVKSEIKAKSPKAPRGPRKPRVKKNV